MLFQIGDLTVHVSITLSDALSRKTKPEKLEDKREIGHHFLKQLLKNKELDAFDILINEQICSVCVLVQPLTQRDSDQWPYKYCLFVNESKGTSCYSTQADNSSNNLSNQVRSDQCERNAKNGTVNGCVKENVEPNIQAEANPNKTGSLNQEKVGCNTEQDEDNTTDNQNKVKLSSLFANVEDGCSEDEMDCALQLETWMTNNTVKFPQD